MISLNDAVGHYVNYTSRIAALWTVFVAATFAAAGFNGIASSNFSPFSRAFLSVGYIAFSCGHWILLRQTILISQTMAREIGAWLADGESTKFRDSVRAIISHNSNLAYSLGTHLVIDACVLLIIWQRPLAALLR